MKIENRGNILKLAGFSFLGLFFAGFFSFIFHLVIINGRYEMAWLLSISAIIFLAYFILQAIFFENKNVGVILIFLECVIFFLGCLKFYNNIYLFLIIGVAFIFLVIAYFRGLGSLISSLKINFFRLQATVLKFATAGLLFFVIGVYSLTFTEGNFFVSKEVMGYFLQPVTPIAKYFLGFDFTFQDKAGDFLGKYFTKSIELPKGQKIDTDVLIKQLERSLQFSIKVNDDVVSMMTDGLNQTFSRQNPDKKSTVVFWGAFLVFIFLTGFTFLINWIIGLLAYLFYHISLSFGLIEIVTTKIDREEIVV